MPDRLSNLANRLRLPFIAGAAGGLVAGVLVIAALAWWDGLFEPQASDPDGMAAALEQMRQGEVGKVNGPHGTTFSIGLGRVAGHSDPKNRDWFWQRVEGLNPATCILIAKNYSASEKTRIANTLPRFALSGHWRYQMYQVFPETLYWTKPELAALRIGPRKITSEETIPSACETHESITAVLPFGETL